MTDNELLTELLSEIRLLRAAIGSTSRSSVELAENAKGAIQITVKAYADSPIDSACIEASAGFATMKREVERGQMSGWAETLATLQAAQAAD